MNKKEATGMVERTLSLYLEKKLEDFEDLYYRAIGSHVPEDIKEDIDLLDECFFDFIDGLGQP